MTPHIAEIQRDVADRFASDAAIEAAWERYREAILRHQEASSEMAVAKQEFETLFLAIE